MWSRADSVSNSWLNLSGSQEAAESSNARPLTRGGWAVLKSHSRLPVKLELLLLHPVLALFQGAGVAELIKAWFHLFSFLLFVISYIVFPCLWMKYLNDFWGHPRYSLHCKLVNEIHFLVRKSKQQRKKVTEMEHFRRNGWDWARHSFPKGGNDLGILKIESQMFGQNLRSNLNLRSVEIIYEILGLKLQKWRGRKRA